MAEKDNVEVFVQYTSDMITILEPDATVRYQNPAIADILGLPPEEVVGKSLFDYVHPEDSEHVTAEFADILNNPGVGSPMEVRVRHVDGSWRHIEGIGNNLLDNPKVEAIVLTSRDVTRRKEAEEKLRESRDLLQAVMDGTTDAVYVKNTEGRYLMINPAGADMLGKTVEEVIGKDDADLFIPEDGERVMAVDREIMETGETKSYEEHKEAEDDMERTYLTTRGPYHDQRGNLVGVFGVSRDITERKEAEDRLGDAEQRFRQLFEQSVDAIYVHDEEGRFVDCNSQACRLLGYSREELLTMFVGDISRNVLTEEERARQERAGGTLWQRTLAGEPGTFSHGHEEKNVRKDGTTFPVEVRVGTVDYGGRRAMLVSVRDITERKEAEEASRKSEERFRSLVQNATDLITVVDAGGIITYESPSKERILGYGPQELVGRPVLEHVHPDDLEHVSAEFVNVLSTPGYLSKEPEEFWYRHADGTWRYLEALAANLLEDPGVGSIVITSRDITDRKKLEEQLSYQAFHDPLTGLPNRSSLQRDFERATKKATNRPATRLYDHDDSSDDPSDGPPGGPQNGVRYVGLLFLDLDGFKEVNDSMGHETGDKLLQAVAERLGSRMRAGDSVARLGGDEFCVLLVSLSESAEAVQTAERLKASLETPFSIQSGLSTDSTSTDNIPTGYTGKDSSQINLSASIGIAVGRLDDNRSLDELLREADAAMYRTKKRGGDLYEIVELKETTS